jgi:cytochrome c
MLLGFALVIAIFMATGAVLAQTEPADLERGEKLWGKCKACHTHEKGGRHIVGPNLWNIFGRKAGTAEGYVYSEAMANSDVIWTDETLDAYLAATQDFMPGSKMYGGLAIEQNRIDLLAWLKTVTEE